MEIRANYQEQYLLPRAIEDWVSEDHPARFIREFVDCLDLKELGFKARQVEQGRPNYASDLLLKVWLYGYLENIRSCRALERACRNQMGLIWLTGCNDPDHNTLWRFWKANKQALRQVFKQCVELARRADVVGMVLHAVDGTKLESAGSKRSALHRVDLEKALEGLDGLIADLEQAIEASEPKEQGEYRLPEALQDAKHRREWMKRELFEMRERKEKRRHGTDPESRMMQTQGRQKWCYNAQAVVDSESGLVVAQEVTNEETDYHQLCPMLEQVEENLEAVAEETVADGGYRSGEQYAKAERRHYGFLVNEHPRERGDEGPFHINHFEYDGERNCCICPQGQVLEYAYFSKKDEARVYRCRCYESCSVRWECSQDKTGRKVQISIYHESLQRQRQKRAQPEKRELFKRRKGIVEPVFGWVKQGMTFRRWSVRGLENVRAQWSLICTVLNLKKLFKSWLEGEFVLG